MKLRTIYTFGFIHLFLSVHGQTLSQELDQLISNWHQAAAKAELEPYMDLLDEDAVFIGTEAGERWDKKSFEKFAKPYFDRKKAWSFTAVERHIHLSADQKWAWFDEVLNTEMKLCRGSGVLVFNNGQWKIQQYVLSMLIPNEKTNEIVKIKTAWDEAWLEKKK
jgi:ketosteroid isomerase-like protein